MHEFKKHLLGQMLIFQESLTLVCVPHFVLNTQEANTTVVFLLKKCLVTFHKLKTVVILQLKKKGQTHHFTTCLYDTMLKVCNFAAK